MKDLLKRFHKPAGIKALMRAKKDFTNPERDWTILLGLFAIGVAGMAVSSYLSFVTYYNIDQRTVNVTVQTIHYQGSLISEQVKDFTEKRKKLTAILEAERPEKATSTNVTDPDPSRRPSFRSSPVTSEATNAI